MSHEPTRHSSGERNRRKALHNAQALKEEIEFLLTNANERLVNLKYAHHRACRMVNRLEAEVAADTKTKTDRAHEERKRADFEEASEPPGCAAFEDAEEGDF